MENPIKSVQQLGAAELLAEDILRDKSELTALDKRRNTTREGLRALANCKTRKAWMTLGPLLIKMPKETAKDALQTDQIKTEREINKLYSNLKEKVNKLRDIEYQDPVPGLHLNPLSREEMNAVQQVFGRRVE